MVFAIGSASRDAPETYNKMKDTIISIIDRYGISKIHYAIITYGNTASISQGFESSFPTAEDLTNFVKSLPRKSGGLAVDKALGEAKKAFDSPAVFFSSCIIEITLYN